MIFCGDGDLLCSESFMIHLNPQVIIKKSHQSSKPNLTGTGMSPLNFMLCAFAMMDSLRIKER